MTSVLLLLEPPDKFGVKPRPSPWDVLKSRLLLLAMELKAGFITVENYETQRELRMPSRGYRLGLQSESKPSKRNKSLLHIWSYAPSIYVFDHYILCTSMCNVPCVHVHCESRSRCAHTHARVPSTIAMPCVCTMAIALCLTDGSSPRLCHCLAPEGAGFCVSKHGHPGNVLEPAECFFLHFNWHDCKLCYHASYACTKTPCPILATGGKIKAGADSLLTCLAKTNEIPGAYAAGATGRKIVGGRIGVRILRAMSRREPCGLPHGGVSSGFDFHVVTR